MSEETAEIQLKQFNKDDDKFYEKIEAPKFMDFTVPDLSRPEAEGIEEMSNLRAICRPHMVFSSFIFCRDQVQSGFSCQNTNHKSRVSSPSLGSPWFDPSDFLRNECTYRVNQRKTLVKASKWTDEKSPYETLEFERDVDEEKIKIAYRRLEKYYHPDG